MQWEGKIQWYSVFLTCWWNILLLQNKREFRIDCEGDDKYFITQNSIFTKSKSIMNMTEVTLSTPLQISFRKTHHTIIGLFRTPDRQTNSLLKKDMKTGTKITENVLQRGQVSLCSLQFFNQEIVSTISHHYKTKMFPIRPTTKWET